MTQAAPTNSLLDVPGLRVGHAAATAEGALSGTTVVVAAPDLLGAGDEGGIVAGVDVRGGGPGTRETDLLDPRNVVERVHAICLTGGSAFGLGAADGVMAGLFERGIGLPMGAPGDVVPLVPSAVIFDLGRGGTFGAYPDATTGRAALDAALGGERPAAPLGIGCVGAGRGAKAGGFKGGIGTASAVCPDGSTVAALIVCNSLGEVVAPDGTFHAGDVLLPGDGGPVRVPSAAELDASRAAATRVPPQPVGTPGLATTIGVVATDATLTKAQCAKLAGVGHDGIGIAIRPAHTMLDGDTLFGLSTTRRPAPDLSVFHEILTAASLVVARAVVRAVLAAETTTTPAGTWRCYRDAFPGAFTDAAGGGADA
ncbi:P1 family peptidase [Mobilicoccus pelagius]|uniref:Putative hydrolase n=1 Tax=Mobilicoccus pelagius NBRC 104925 TaxID=1089455 RepID=H5UPU2_9MICO|nr:P1 family peptidase [Mobilicoccus pelagius]GAB47747.1 putative hydrolase [Mobilicoccus pelagius NBRC 104925]